MNIPKYLQLYNYIKSAYLIYALLYIHIYTGVQEAEIAEVMKANIQAVYTECGYINIIIYIRGLLCIIIFSLISLFKLYCCSTLPHENSLYSTTT